MARMKKNTALEGAGDELTEWATPAWCVDGLVDHWPELVAWSRTKPILEPEAGSGAIVRALVARGARVSAIEVRDTRAQLAAAGAESILIADFCQLGLELWTARRPFAIMMNPPFRPPHVMLRHVRRALELARGFVAALLPLSFLSGGSGRAAFWAAAPPLTQLLFFEERPVFVGDGGLFECAWFVWCAAASDAAIEMEQSLDGQWRACAPRAPVMIPAPVRGETFNW